MAPSATTESTIEHVNPAPPHPASSVRGSVFASRAVRAQFTGGVVSFVAHAFLFVVLALVLYCARAKPHLATELTVIVNEDEALFIDQFTTGNIPDVAGAAPQLDIGVPPTEQQIPAAVIQWPGVVAERPRQVPLARVLPDLDWTVSANVPTGGGLEGRAVGLRGRLLARRGGTALSESAVAGGLRWLAAHQRKDGSWRFDHREGPCQGHCRNPGNFASTTASTALALLPFYGAGYTHEEGEYKDTVNRGLYYLGTQMLLTPHGGDLQRGSMYGQGLATIVLCEAYAMTGDETLRDFAQAALDFVVYAQHPEGGWRYLPGQPGDTTVTGWQLMALKSGRMAELKVPYDSLYRAGRFLDGVETANGAEYGYQTPESRTATTAIGLYCRMLTGWQHDHPALRQGVQQLDRRGPSSNDIYYNYYATQVMNHFGGGPWRRWNEKMRDQLIRDQQRSGHEAGSWHYEHKHSKVGGRLFNTCLAVMTLEVYYRYMPLYGPSAVVDF